MPFDTENGLVYSEKIVKNAVCQQHLASRPRRGQNDTIGLQSKGYSLEGTAIRLISRNLQSLTSPMVRALPETSAKKLWFAIARECKISVDVWKLFATTYLPSTERCYQWRIDCACAPYKYVVENVASQTHDWNVDMAVMTAGGGAPTITALRQLSNLTTLRIHCREDVLDDRTVRICTELPGGIGFSALKVLVLDHQSALTKSGLNYLTRLPKLTTILARDCGFTRRGGKLLHQQELSGWRVNLDETAIRLELQQDFICRRCGADSMGMGICTWPSFLCTCVPLIQVLLGDVARSPPFPADSLRRLVMLTREPSIDVGEHSKRKGISDLIEAGPRLKRRHAPPRLEADLNAMITST